MARTYEGISEEFILAGLTEIASALKGRSLEELLDPQVQGSWIGKIKRSEVTESEFKELVNRISAQERTFPSFSEFELYLKAIRAEKPVYGISGWNCQCTNCGVGSIVRYGNIPDPYKHFWDCHNCGARLRVNDTIEEGSIGLPERTNERRLPTDAMVTALERIRALKSAPAIDRSPEERERAELIGSIMSLLINERASEAHGEAEGLETMKDWRAYFETADITELRTSLKLIRKEKGLVSL